MAEHNSGNKSNTSFNSTHWLCYQN